VSEHRSGQNLAAVWQGPKDGPVSASIVIARSVRPAGVTLGGVMEAGRAGLRRANPGATIGPLVSQRLGGVPAASFDITSGQAKVRQLGAIRGDRVYLVRFTAAREAFDRRVATLDALLRSWRWAT
jgi:hypothetical protein